MGGCEKASGSFPVCINVRQCILQSVWLPFQRVTSMPGQILLLEKGVTGVHKMLKLFVNLLSCSTFADLFTGSHVHHV